MQAVSLSGWNFLQGSGIWRQMKTWSESPQESSFEGADGTAFVSLYHAHTHTHTQIHTKTHTHARWYLPSPLPFLPKLRTWIGGYSGTIATVLRDVSALPVDMQGGRWIRARDWERVGEHRKISNHHLWGPWQNPPCRAQLCILAPPSPVSTLSHPPARELCWNLRMQDCVTSRYWEKCSLSHKTRCLVVCQPCSAQEWTNRSVAENKYTVSQKQNGFNNNLHI